LLDRDEYSDNKDIGELVTTPLLFTADGSTRQHLREALPPPEKSKYLVESLTSSSLSFHVGRFVSVSLEFCVMEAPTSIDLSWFIFISS
jgi:hypothetical protein